MKRILLAVLLLNFSVKASAAQYIQSPDDFDPADPNYERYYDPDTGLPLDDGSMESRVVPFVAGCYRTNCAVFVRVSMAEQTAYIYVDGIFRAAWLVSTGLYAATKAWDNHPTNRIYDRYDSKRYPEGDYNGLGNMPYAVFYYKGFAIHGTPKANWPKLGTRASHGCIRMHPDNAKKVNRLVRAYGPENTWFLIQ
jgi:hypothetical protein